MNIDTFQEMSKRTMPKPEAWGYTAMDKSNYAMGLGGEAGEVVDLMKKEIHHNHPVDVDKVKKELGDVMHYAAGVATMYGLSMSDILKANLTKLAKRYPVGFNPEDSIKRRDVE